MPALYVLAPPDGNERAISYRIKLLNKSVIKNTIAAVLETAHKNFGWLLMGDHFAHLEVAVMSLQDSLSGSMAMNTSAMTKSEYDKVIFHDVAESYVTDADVDCRFTLTPSICPMEGDQIALFKVGWETTHQCIVSELVTLPDESDRNGEMCILFKAQNLPKDDGEFYQFCYRTFEGHVRGASTPFRFRRPADDDLVEVEDSDNDLMIIRTRTAIIEEKLRDFAIKNSQLLKEKGVLEDKIGAKEKNCAELENKLKVREEDLTKLHQEMITMTATQEHERHDLMEKMEEMSLVSQKHNLDTTKALLQNEAYVSELRDTIKVLSEQKDDLSEKLATEIKETISFKKQFQDTESRLKAFMQKSDQLTKELIIQRDSASKLQLQVKTLDNKLKEEQERNSSTKEKLNAAELESQRFVAQLVDTEHMLAAMEKSKHLATEELMTHTAFKEKISVELDKVEKDYEKVQTDYEMMKKKYELQLESYSALEKQYTALSAKYDIMKENNIKAIEIEEKRTETEERLRSMINDLTARLKTGASEYQNKYIECAKLEKKLNKLKQKYKTNIQQNKTEVKEEANSNSENSTVGDEERVHNEEKLKLFSDIISRKDLKIAELTSENNKLKMQLEKNTAERDDKKERVLFSTRSTANGSSEQQTKFQTKTLNYPHVSWTDALKPKPSNTGVFQSNTEHLFRIQNIEPKRISKINSVACDGITQWTPRSASKILPPPIQPELTEKARIAAMTAASRQKRELREFDGLVSRGGEVHRADSAYQTAAPSAPQNEEVDADFICPVCGVTYPAPYNVREVEEHVNSHFAVQDHESSQPSECPHCHVVFTISNQFDAHLATHYQHFEFNSDSP